MGVLRLVFLLESKEDIILPIYKGSTFHGGFGHALETISPAGFQYFFRQHEITSGVSLNPYLLTPPGDTQTEYRKGKQFQLELTLFGVAAKEWHICYEAIKYLGDTLGIGYRKTKFNIVDIQQKNFTPTSTPKEASNITLGFPTRLRFKINNQFCKTTPEFSFIIKRLHERAERLHELYQSPPSPIDITSLMPLAQNVRIANHSLRWDDWSRFSGRQKQWMKFGGLVGSVSYTGDIIPFLPLLQLGEWLHLGSKSSFGLGKYEITNGELK